MPEPTRTSSFPGDCLEIPLSNSAVILDGRPAVKGTIGGSAFRVAPVSSQLTRNHSPTGLGLRAEYQRRILSMMFILTVDMGQMVVYRDWFSHVVDPFVWDNDGALVIYDAKTLEEVKRLPMRKPSGKYNVHNKLTRSSGTSH